MDKLTICVNELLNNHGWWLSEKSPQYCLLENEKWYFCWLFCPRIYADFEWRNIPISQLECFFLTLIWQSQMLVYKQVFDWSLFPSLLSNLLISLPIIPQWNDIHWNFLSFWRLFNSLMAEWIYVTLLPGSESNFSIDCIAETESVNITVLRGHTSITKVKYVKSLWFSLWCVASLA
jgi:hypothetical protein